MKVIDKRTIATKEFGELPIGAVFEFPAGRYAECYGICMKIDSANCMFNAFDFKDHCIFAAEANVKVCELNANLVIEGRK